jgi:hypothetical protein
VTAGVTIVINDNGGNKNGSGPKRLLSWLRSRDLLSITVFLAPLFVLVFLGLFRWLSLQSPQLLGANVSFSMLGVTFTVGSAAGLFLSAKAPTLLHRTGMPGILMLIAPFLKTGMWESEELAGVMRRSWDLMTKHVGFIQQLNWTQKYASKPSNFTMSEAISLILKLLPPVEKHSATCARCN